MDGSSSGESCDGTVATAVVVGPADDETGDAHGLTPSAIVGPHHYITVAGKCPSCSLQMAKCDQGNNGAVELSS